VRSDEMALPAEKNNFLLNYMFGAEKARRKNASPVSRPTTNFHITALALSLPAAPAALARVCVKFNWS
jgi:hypothetical protein